MAALTSNELYEYLRDHRDITPGLADAICNPEFWPEGSARRDILDCIARAWGGTNDLLYEAYCWSAFFNPVTDKTLEALPAIQTGRFDKARGYYGQRRPFADSKVELFKAEGYLSDYPELYAELCRLHAVRTATF